jgi:hypothetical protein
MICFDRLAEIVARVGSRPTPRIVRRSDGACLISRRQTFEDVAETAFGLTRRAVAADPIVARHVAVMLGRIGTTVQSRYRPQLAAQVVALLATVESTTSLGYDLEPVREASRTSLAILGHGHAAGAGSDGNRLHDHAAGRP